MGEPRLTVPAERDLIDIWVFIAEDNYDAAEAFIARIHALCRKLAQSPGMGRPRPEIGERVLSFGIGRYSIFYWEVAGGIEVLRVVHDSRHIPSLQ